MNSNLDDIFAPEDLEILHEEISTRVGNAFNLKTFCTAPNGVFYKQQYASITDPNPFVTDVTTRRAGKTAGRAGDHIDTSLRHEGSNSIYITLTRSNAKKIMFPVLHQINRKYRLGAEANISDLSFKFPNDSMIYLAGANDSQAIHNFRGMKFKLATIDEAQSMRPYIEELIDEVLGPTLIDENGRLRITGTPGAVPIGYFHKIAHSAQWKHHFYTMFDNPFIADAKARLELELKRRGVTLDDPKIQREFLGKWSLDLDSLVFKYHDACHYEELPAGHTWDHIVSVDMGFDDSDAIAVIAFAQTCPDAYLIDELITAKQGITPLANQITKKLQEYKPMRIVGDFGGLGKKIGEELQKRFSIPIEAAEKSRKWEYIELLNDGMRTLRFRAKRTSRFAQDCMLVEKDMSNPEKPKIDARYHTDIGEAVLYGYREALHWLYQEKIEEPKKGSVEDFKLQEDELWENVRNQIQAHKDEGDFWKDDWEDT